MIRYRELKVENYKSIESATVIFTPGVFNVVGETFSGDYSSNGSGKSSILQALTLVLFNKDFQGAPLDTVSNRYTGKPFKISLLMDVERAGMYHTYQVVNDRASKKLSIYRNGKVHTDGTVKSLKVLSELLGMSEATFKFTHYITTNSILDLTDNLSNATLFNEVLQVTELNKMGQDLLDVKKRIKKELDVLLIKQAELKSIEKLLKVSQKFNLPDLKEAEESLKIELGQIQGIYVKHVEPVKDELDSTNELLREKRITLKHKKDSATKGKCELCGSMLLDVEQLRELHATIANLELEIGDLEVTLEEITTRYNELHLAFLKSSDDINVQLENTQKDILIAEQMEQLYTDTVNSEFSKEEFEDINNTISYKFGLIGAIDSMRDAIRSGRIYEEVMAEFFKLVNLNIQRYRQVVNFNAYDVYATSHKSGMLALLKFHDTEVPVESLSNGEKARLSLLLLSALLESMSQVTNSESNFLALDEATSSFDKSGIEELSALFEHLKVLEQSVFIITHGTELSKVNFDGTLKLTKHDHISTAEFIKE